MVDVPGTVDDCVLLYGHLDKQPEFSGWSDGLEPWTPVLRDGKLYGRGGADDGYALFASLTAIRALREQGIAARPLRGADRGQRGKRQPRPRPPHRRARRAPRPPDPGRVPRRRVRQLRAAVVHDLAARQPDRLAARRRARAKACTRAPASGIVPSSFRILRELLARVEDATSGAILVEELNAPIPPDRLAQARAAAARARRIRVREIPARCRACGRCRTIPSSCCSTTPGADAERHRRRRPARLPQRGQRAAPVHDAQAVVPPAADAGRRPCGRDAPSSARSSATRLTARGSASTWNRRWAAGMRPPFAPWLEQSMQAASQAFFGRDAMYMGTGGSIPFMGMLGEKFPGTQFLVTGVLGPQSNAHGPNEFLHLDTARATDRLRGAGARRSRRKIGDIPLSGKQGTFPGDDGCRRRGVRGYPPDSTNPGISPDSPAPRGELAECPLFPE